LKRQTTIEVALFLLLVSAGVTLRVALQEIPNFAPVAALALFSGYFFRSRVMAITVPVSIMAISDFLVIGGYAWWQMAIVYSMLALPVLMRGFLREHFQFASGRFAEVARSLCGLLGCSLLGSVLFFVVTNAMCLGWYEPTWAGVVRCYTQALPFFRFTLYGDAAFAVLTFGSYAAVMSCIAAMRSKREAPVAGKLATSLE